MLAVALDGNSLMLAGIGIRIRRRTTLRTEVYDATRPEAPAKSSAVRRGVAVAGSGTGQPRRAPAVEDLIERLTTRLKG